jgi:hypothetical protein
MPPWACPVNPRAMPTCRRGHVTCGPAAFGLTTYAKPGYI